MNNFGFKTMLKNGNKNLWLKVLWYVFLLPIAITIYIVKNKKMNRVAKGTAISVMWAFFLAAVALSRPLGNTNESDNLGVHNVVSQVNTESNDKIRLNDVRKIQFDNVSGDNRNSMELPSGIMHDGGKVEVAQEKHINCGHAKLVSNLNANSMTVYVTPSGKRYHYSQDCGGKSSKATTLEAAERLGLTPCQKCAK